MFRVDEPLLCVTSDLDWAADVCVQDLLETLAALDIRPTVFATHRSPVVDRFQDAGRADVGLHPNFLPASSHGADPAAVIAHMLGLYPAARAYRSHCFADDSRIGWEFVRRGFRYDSNLCLFLQPGLVPLFHGTGLIRFPVFWEDDIHYTLTGGDWSVEAFIAHFRTPGLKIVNVHPFMFATNVPTEDYYRQVKGHIASLDAATLPSVRFAGPGTRTFVTELLARLIGEGFRFHTLHALYERFVPAELGETHRRLLRRLAP